MISALLFACVFFCCSASYIYFFCFFFFSFFNPKETLTFTLNNLIFFFLFYFPTRFSAWVRFTPLNSFFFFFISSLQSYSLIHGFFFAFKFRGGGGKFLLSLVPKNTERIALLTRFTFFFLFRKVIIFFALVRNFCIFFFLKHRTYMPYTLCTA